jgi:hypothetical protein
MPRAEGKTFSFLSEDTIDPNLLETIDFENEDGEFVKCQTD